MSSAGLQFPTLDAAIQTLEGYYPGSLSYRNQNPGNIQYGSFAASMGGTPGAGGFAQFPNLASGTAAEDALLGLYAQQGLTVGQAAQKWTGGTAPSGYAPYLAQQAGVGLDTPLSAIGSGGGGTATPGPTTTGPGATWLGGILQGLAGALGSTPLGAATGMGGLSWARVASFLVGLILIIMALVGFNRVQTTVVEGVRTARDAVVA